MRDTAICIENYSSNNSDVNLDLSYQLNAKEPYVLFKDYVNYFSHACFRFVYVFFGILQFLVIKNIFAQFFHYDNAIISVISFILAVIPVFGPLFAMYGACSCWGWDVLQAVAVFVLPYLLVHSPLFIVTFFDIYKDYRRWKIEGRI